jgi:hypothetical protein
MKVLGILESKWDPIRKKLVRRLLEEQDKVLWSYFAQKGGTRSKGGDRGNCNAREHVQWPVEPIALAQQSRYTSTRAQGACRLLPVKTRSTHRYPHYSTHTTVALARGTLASRTTQMMMMSFICSFRNKNYTQALI